MRRHWLAGLVVLAAVTLGCQGKSSKSDSPTGSTTGTPRAEELTLQGWTNRSPWKRSGGRYQFVSPEAMTNPFAPTPSAHDPTYWSFLENELNRGPVHVVLMDWEADFDVFNNSDLPVIRLGAWQWVLSRSVWIGNPGFYSGGDGEIDQLVAQFGSDFQRVLEAIILQYAVRLRGLLTRYPTLRITIVAGEDSRDHTEEQFRSALRSHFSGFETRVQQKVRRR